MVENTVDPPRQPEMEIGAFRIDDPIELRRLPNGGWVVSQRGTDARMMGSELGAYATAKEMLAVLSKHLT